MGDKCREIIRGNQWSYKVTDATYKEIDVDGDSTMSPGDMTTFTNGVVNVFGRRDGAVVATGSIDGTCTVLPTDSIDREFCQVTFNFGAAGTVSARGPLEQVRVDSSYCFVSFSIVRCEEWIKRNATYGQFVPLQTFDFALLTFNR